MHVDPRGSFVKPFARAEFLEAGLTANWAECFWSTSHFGVVRGFHLQLPPHEHDKLVVCVAGVTHNVALDVRVGSPAFARSVAVQLSPRSPNALYVPRGVAHAFQALSEEATLLYLVASAHASSHDGGVRWDSAGVRWPLPAKDVSERDQALPPLDRFDSPFRFPA